MIVSFAHGEASPRPTIQKPNSFFEIKFQIYKELELPKNNSKRNIKMQNRNDDSKQEIEKCL